MLKAKKAAAVYQKYKRGDAITDRELKLALKELEPTIVMLKELGTEFHLAWKELFMAYQSLSSFSDIRSARARRVR